MKKKILFAICVFAIGGFISIKPALAEDKNANKQAQHEGHHADASAKTSVGTKPTGDQSMMGKMDMSQMQGMMHECMKMHKDSKMCDHSMMEKCQKEMGKDECKMMMNQAKSQGKNQKK